ncbi:MAG: WYL domain-containing protein, partial [Planctomycetota bacterium]|nr:WYL domain-containing protein [Planctomycetota bacterium]
VTDKTFEKPRSFNAQRYRRPDFYRPSPSDETVRVRFAEPAARYVREMGPPGEIKEKAHGALERNVRTDSHRWVVDWALQHGDHAEVVGPPAARREAKAVVDEWLAFYEKHKR